jgi:hypothetical protein
VARLILLLLLLPGWAAADEIVAHPLTEGAVVTVDGLLDEAAWDRATPITAFTGIAPTEGFDPAGATEVRVLVGEKKLYIGFRCDFDEPTRVRGYYAAREDVNQDDQVGIYLDPFGDGRRTYIMYINAVGVQQDFIVTLDGRFNGAWDAVFQSRGRIREGGYDVELAIPFQSLRFPVDSDRPWRAMFTRKFAARDEKAAFPAVRRDLGPYLLQYAPLTGVSPQRSGLGLEILPTIVLRTGQDRETPDDELKWREPGFPETVDPSVGVKVQLTPASSLDATLNPDFSQVEADPDFVDNNLRFALFLAERRPFFQEGAERFDSSLLYTRSLVDPLYGVKATGKEGPLAFGVLHGLDERPASSFVGERVTPGFSAADVEDAMAFVSFAGGRVDLGRNSQFYFGYSDKELIGRELGEHRSDHHGGRIGARIGLDDVSWIDVAGAVASTGAVDGDRIFGGQAGISAARDERLQGLGGSVGFTSPDYRAENGFLTRPDFLRARGWARKRFEWVEGPVSWLEFSANASHGFDGFGERVTSAGGSVGGNAAVRLPALTEVRGDVSVWDTLFADQSFQGARGGVSVSNRALEAIQGSVSASVGDAIRFSDATPSYDRRISASVSTRAMRRVSLQVSTTMSWLGFDGEDLEQLIIYRGKVLVGITRAVSARLIVQGRQNLTLDTHGNRVDPSNRLDISALVSFLPSPGTAVHVGLGERLNWGAEDAPRPDRRDVFLKASLLIRL